METLSLESTRVENHDSLKQDVLFIKPGLLRNRVKEWAVVWPSHRENSAPVKRVVSCRFLLDIEF